MWLKCQNVTQGGGKNLTFTNLKSIDNTVTTSVTLNDLENYQYLLLVLGNISASSAYPYTREQWKQYTYFNEPNAIELTPSLFGDNGPTSIARMYLLPINTSSITLTNLRFYSCEIFGVTIS